MPRKRKSTTTPGSDTGERERETPFCSSSSSSDPRRLIGRQLSFDDQDRLGRPVELSLFLSRIEQGRGAAVCISAALVSITSTTDTHSVCHLRLRTPSTSQPQPLLTASFYGPLADLVFSHLAPIHRQRPPAKLHLSGYAATRTPAAEPSIEYRDAHLVIRISAPSAPIWIERFPPPLKHEQEPADTNTNTSSLPLPLPLPLAQIPPPNQRQRHNSNNNNNSSSSSSNDWFSTPAPPPSAPPTKPDPDPQPPAAPTRRTVTSNTTTSLTRPKRDTRVRVLGSTEYTPIASLRNGERCNVLGVVVGSGDPRRATGGTRDLSYKVTLADSSSASTLTVMLFAPAGAAAQIPHPLGVGQVLLLRRVVVQDFSGRPQAVGKRGGAWNWSVYDAAKGVRGSPGAPALSGAEEEALRDLAAWYACSGPGSVSGPGSGAGAGAGSGSGSGWACGARPTLRLDEIGENVFFDTVVEVLKVYTHAYSPDLYVTDYTRHPMVYRGNDQYLPLPLPAHEAEAPAEAQGEGEGWGAVFQIGLWDAHAELAGGLRTGDVVRIQNVRAKLNPRGMLVGGLGSASDSGVKIRTLKEGEEARLVLEERRRAFIHHHHHHHHHHHPRTPSPSLSPSAGPGPGVGVECCAPPSVGRSTLARLLGTSALPCAGVVDVRVAAFHPPTGDAWIRDHGYGHTVRFALLVSDPEGDPDVEAGGEAGGGEAPVLLHAQTALRFLRIADAQHLTQACVDRVAALVGMRVTLALVAYEGRSGRRLAALEGANVLL